MTRTSLMILALVAACRSPAAPVPPPPAPKLVVLIVIDQLASWSFERDRDLFTGGLGRMLREGAYVQAAELPYANTFTSPGHATIATGAVPRIHGIVGNQWWSRAEQRERSAESDPTAPIFAVANVPTPPTSNGSGRALRVPGIADALRAATGDQGHTVAIALKARSACLVAGQHPELALWYDASAGGMTTSSAYAHAAVPWLVDLAREKPAARFIGQTWSPLDPALLAKHTKIADDAPGEGALHGMGVAFPHLVHDAEELVHTPFADEIVLDAVYAVLDRMQLGADDIPDLLAISFSAHDYAGHNWGPDSWEVLDLTLRLDAALGTLFATLDRRLGPQGWAAVVTSDHGVTPLVERSPVAGAKRVSPAEIAATAGPLVSKVASNEIYLSADWEKLAAPDRRAALDAAIAAVRAKYPELDVFDTSDTSHCQEATLAGDVCRAVVPGEAGEIYVAPRRGFVVTEYKTGTHHDAPNADNNQVPILVRGPGIARQTIPRASLLQIAPTLAALLGVPPPRSASEKPLFGLEVRSPAPPSRTPSSPRAY